MHIDLMRDKSKAFPAIAQPEALTSLRVWHCAYQTLAPLSTFPNLRTLVIATFPDTTLTPLASLNDLRYLSILHLPRVTDLSPLIGLSRLECLELQTLPSWDASGKTTEVDSLDPIGELHNLQHLALFGVRPKNRSLKAIERCVRLQSARFSKYPKSEVERFYRVKQVSDAHVPNPEFEAG